MLLYYYLFFKNSIVSIKHQEVQGELKTPVMRM